MQIKEDLGEMVVERWCNLSHGRGTILSRKYSYVDLFDYGKIGRGTCDVRG